MVKKILICWREIPSQVIAQRGRKREKVMLTHRFQEAIDRAAMRAGKGSSDAYMEDWRRDTTMVETDLDLREFAEAEAARLEAGFTDEQLTQLIRGHGKLSEQ